MPDLVRTVGRYSIVSELGRGGMAVVYLARQHDLDRLVALKELAAFHAASDPSFAQRFVRESRLAGSLVHPNVITVFDYFEHDGTPYIAMEYVERGSLRPYVGRMTLAQIGGVLEGLLAGLGAAEQHGIVHRDLKPENLMVSASGSVKIADFGIARATQAADTGSFLTATGTTVGTPPYMAPEQPARAPCRSACRPSLPLAVRIAPVCGLVVAFAIPKSAIFTLPVAVTIRFSGLRSRCTIPCSSAAPSPASRPSSTPAICASVIRPTYGRSEPPSTYSIAMRASRGARSSRAR